MSACTSTKTLVVNVEKPAEINLPQNITIVNNSLLETSLDNSEQHNVMLDSIDIQLMNSILHNLDSKQYFSRVTLFPEPTKSQTDNTNEISRDKLIKILTQTNSDAILSIDKLLFKTNNSSNYDPYENTWINSLDLEIFAICNSYTNDGYKIAPLLITDTIYWTEILIGRELVSEPIPSLQQAMTIGTSYLAEQITNRLAPHWEQQNRLYYSDSKEANKFFDSDNLLKARSIWESEYDKEKKTKRKARLANNIALTYELEDNFDQAIRWATLSCQHFTEDLTTSLDQYNLDQAKSYQQILINRKNDLTKFANF